MNENNTTPEVERWHMPSGRIGTIDLTQNPAAVDALRETLRAGGATPLDDDAPVLDISAADAIAHIATAHHVYDRSVDLIMVRLARLMPKHSTPLGHGNRTPADMRVSAELANIADTVTDEITDAALERAINRWMNPLPIPIRTERKHIPCKYAWCTGYHDVPDEDWHAREHEVDGILVDFSIDKAGPYIHDTETGRQLRGTDIDDWACAWQQIRDDFQRFVREVTPGSAEPAHQLIYSETRAGSEVLKSWALPSSFGPHPHCIDYDDQDGWRVSPSCPVDAMTADEYATWSSEIQALSTEYRRLQQTEIAMEAAQ